MVFSDLEKRVLEMYVTSADSQIYAVKHTVPQEVFGAFGSYFSRNPKDLREHLLEAIKGTIDEGTGITKSESGEKINLEESLRQIADNAVDPAKALMYGLSKSRDFFKRWYGIYSHKSIANTVWISMVANNVSQLFAKELAYDQLAFFIEQSTRYVNWSANMYLDPNVMNSGHRERFTNTLTELMMGYERLKDISIQFYKEKNPFDKWLEKQPERIKKDTRRVQERIYEKQIGGAALDVARSLLPQASKTNIAWVLDARSTELDIAKWKGHPLIEMAEIAKLIEEHAGQIAPSLLKYTTKNEFYERSLNDYDLLQDSPRGSFEKSVDIISYDPDSLNKVIAHLLKRHNFGGTFQQRYGLARNQSFKEKIKFLNFISARRGSHDEWISEGKEFDLVKTTIELRTDIGTLRDWRRHQKWDRSEALYTTENGFDMPPMINDMTPEAKEVFERSVSIADETNTKMRPTFPYESQYVVPMATRHAITMSAGLDQMQYMLWTRSTPEGNYSYRQDAFNLAEAFVKTHPWFLGYETYPENKPFMEVYKDAPLKNLLRLQIGEVSLHT